jgi:hypothetical protein
MGRIDGGLQSHHDNTVAGKEFTYVNCKTRFAEHAVRGRHAMPSSMFAAHQVGYVGS